MLITNHFGCLILFFSTIIVLEAGDSSTTPINQTLALKHLYDATNGPVWVYHDGIHWNFSQPLDLTDPCLGWDGVTCHCVEALNSSELSCNIIELSLFWVDLEGRIPPTLNMLQNLTSLNLGFNIITGFIPPELFSMTALTFFDLGYNSLTGTIPEESAQIVGCNHFNVFHNFLSGSIPQGIDKWTNLKVCDAIGDCTNHCFAGRLFLHLSHDYCCAASTRMCGVLNQFSC